MGKSPTRQLHYSNLPDNDAVNPWPQG
jgi:hypothetical protein